MQVSAGQLVIEYGGKLQACERRVAKAIETLTAKSASHEGTVKEAVVTVQHLRARFNLILTAHSPAVESVLSGDVPAGEPGDMLALSRDQVWVVESIEDLYGRLAAA